MIGLAQRHRATATLAFALTAASLFTLFHFNQSVWIDEGASIWFARLPLDKLFTSICEPVTPLYHLLLRAALTIDDSDAWLRLPSLLVGLLAIVAIYRLGTEAFGPTTAGLAAVLLALQPLHSWYASEIRMHAFGASLGLVAVWLGYRLIARASNTAIGWFNWGVYILAATLALWMDYTTFLVWGLLQIIWWIIGSPQPRRWLSAQASVLGLVVLRITPNQLVSLSSNIYPTYIAVRANNLGIPLTPSLVSTAMLIVTAIGLLACLGAAIVWRRRGFKWSPNIKWLIIGLWVALVVWAVLPQAYTVKRRLIVIMPYLALATAYFAAQLPRQIRLGLVVIGGVATILSVTTLQREPWRSVVDDLLATQPQSGTIAWIDDMAVPPFDYYWQRAGSPEVIQWAPLNGRALPQTPQLVPSPGGILWIVVAESAYRQMIQFLPADFAVNYELISERHETGIGVYQYQRRIQPDPTITPAPEPPFFDRWGLLLPSPLGSCAP